MLLQHHGLELPVWDGSDALGLTTNDLIKLAKQEGRERLTRSVKLYPINGVDCLKTALGLADRHFTILANKGLPAANYYWLLLPIKYLQEQVQKQDNSLGLSHYEKLRNPLAPKDFILGASVEVIKQVPDDSNSYEKTLDIIRQYHTNFYDNKIPCLGDMGAHQTVYGRPSSSNTTNTQPQRYIVDIEPRFSQDTYVENFEY